jgi:hypothetical protein
MGYPAITMQTMVTIGKIIAAVKAVATVAVAATVAKGAYDTWNPPKTPDPSFKAFDVNIGASKYKYAPTQDVNIGYQNYMDNLLKTAPYYVSRYNQDGALRDNFVKTVNMKERQAARDQPKIHSSRLPAAKIQIETERRL